MEATREQYQAFNLPVEDLTKIIEILQHSIQQKQLESSPANSRNSPATNVSPWTEETFTQLLGHSPLSAALLRSVVEGRSTNQHEKHVNRMMGLARDLVMEMTDYQEYIRTDQGSAEKRHYDNMAARATAAQLERLRHEGMVAPPRADAVHPVYPIIPPMQPPQAMGQQGAAYPGAFPHGFAGQGSDSQ